MDSDTLEKLRDDADWERYMDSRETCQWCDGTGINYTSEGQAFRCPDCHGSGEVVPEDEE